jgi:Ca2+-binding EF-hand superfamily protein
MNMTVEYSYVTYTGIPMIILGLVAMAAGLHASMNLDQLKSSLTDESYLWEKFKRCDGDQDDSLDLEGFAELLWSLGLEFDDMYTHRAFYQIGREKEKLVSFDEFKKWWIVTQNDGKRLRGGYGKD